MSRFLKAELQKIEAYTPGEQPQDKKYVKRCDQRYDCIQTHYFFGSDVI